MSLLLIPAGRCSASVEDAQLLETAKLGSSYMNEVPPECYGAVLSCDWSRTVQTKLAAVWKVRLASLIDWLTVDRLTVTDSTELCQKLSETEKEQHCVKMAATRLCQMADGRVSNFTESSQL